MSEIRIESIQYESAYCGRPVAGHYFYDPDEAPRIILQLMHGMSEYVLRYRPFAEFMVRQGIAVCGNDALGHGDTSGEEYMSGYFGPRGGREYLLRDAYKMNRLARERWPGVPLVLLGHSMGSFLARWMMEVYPAAADAVILSGTGSYNPLTPFGVLISSATALLRGPKFHSKLCENMAFGTYLARIPSPKTPDDWLSTNEENVAAYEADPKCGFPFTVSALREVALLSGHVCKKAWAAGVRRNVPVLLIAGAEDPVGSYGKGPTETAALLRGAGVADVTLHIYDGLRHEILNETGREAIWQELAGWCTEKTACLQADKT